MTFGRLQCFTGIKVGAGLISYSSHPALGHDVVTYRAVCHISFFRCPLDSQNRLTPGGYCQVADDSTDEGSVSGPGNTDGVARQLDSSGGTAVGGGGSVVAAEVDAPKISFNTTVDGALASFDQKSENIAFGSAAPREYIAGFSAPLIDSL